MNLKGFYKSISGNYDDAILRLMNEKFILKYVMKFSGFEELDTVKKATDAGEWETAFRACHTLKGMAANLSFDALFKVSSELCELLRPCRKPECDISSLIVLIEKELNIIDGCKKMIDSL